MVQTIHKYAINTLADTYKLPKGAQILCVQVQHGRPYMWALVDPAAPMVARGIVVYGTGFDVPRRNAAVEHYIGTVQLNDGGLVWHIFDRGESPREPPTSNRRPP